MNHTVLPANSTLSAFTPSRRASPPFGRYSLRLPTKGWPGWVDMGGWLDWDKFPHRELNPDTVTHPSTNRARRRVTSLTWPTSLPTAPNHQLTMILAVNRWFFAKGTKVGTYHDTAIILSKSKSQFFKIVGDRNRDIFHVRTLFSTNFNVFMSNV